MTTRNWKRCSRCQAKTKSVRFHKGSLLCWPCYQSITKRMPSNKSLEEALNKVYYIKNRYISVPEILFGTKVKLLLIEEEEKDEIK
jgi:hypothetical protein